MIYEKTPQGVEAFQQKPNGLPPRLRSVLIMIDGKRSDVDLQLVLTAIGGGQEHIDELLRLGLIIATDRPVAAAKSSAAVGHSNSSAIDVTHLNDQQRYQLAYPIATRLTSGLGLRGFRLNLAVESAGSLSDLILLAERISEAVGEAKYQELKPYLTS